MIAQTTFGTDQWLEFLGRLHPLVLHLPIGLFASLILVEVTTLFAPAVRPARRVMHLALGASAVAAAFTGWFLAGDGSGYPAELLREHRLLGLGMAGAAVLGAVCEVVGRGRSMASLRVALLVACGAMLGAGGHRGGMMTHGQRFLSDKAPAWLAPYVGPRPRERARTSRDDVAPVADARPDPEEIEAAQEEPTTEPATESTTADHAAATVGIDQLMGAVRESCLECHCESKTKGDLRLDLVEGWVASVDVGDPEFSELLYRVTLPADDPDVMPPDGDPMGAEAIAELRHWIEGGADPAVIEAALKKGP